MKKIIVITVVLGFVGCVALKLRAPAISDLEMMQQRVPGITYQEALAGFNLYKTKCNSCHGLHRTDEFTKRSWERLLQGMLVKAKVFDFKDKKNLTEYLIADSK